MYSFNYHKSSNVENAVDLRSQLSDGLYLAGGMTLIPSMKLRLSSPSDLIDLSSIAELSGISQTANGLRIGSMTRHCDVASSAQIPALAALASQIGDNQVRNRGTLGGSLANSDPAADYPAAVVGLGATIHTHARDIDGDAFFVDLFETNLAENELITAVTFAIPKRAAYIKIPNPASRYAIVGVMVAETDAGVRVGVTGAGPCAYRASDLETALNQSLSADAVSTVSIDYSNFNSDIHASAEYRGHLVSVAAARAVQKLSG